MNGTNRALVEAIKRAKEIRVILNPYDNINQIVFPLVTDRRLKHEIGLAFQSYYINKEKEERMTVFKND